MLRISSGSSIVLRKLLRSFLGSLPNLISKYFKANFEDDELEAQRDAPIC